MTNRILGIAGILCLVASFGILAAARDVNSRTERAIKAAVAREEAARARLKVVMDQHDRDLAAFKAELDDLLKRLDGAEAVRPGRVWRESGERRVD